MNLGLRSYYPHFSDSVFQGLEGCSKVWRLELRVGGLEFCGMFLADKFESLLSIASIAS